MMSCENRRKHAFRTRYDDVCAVSSTRDSSVCSYSLFELIEQLLIRSRRI